MGESMDRVASAIPLGALPKNLLEPITEGEAFEEPEEYKGSVGRTMFDLPSAEDGSLTVLLPKDEIEKAPLQALVRISSIGDNRKYLGIVVSGPFAEPDGLRGDANVIVTTAVRGGIFMPRYHGRVQVELLGEEIDGQLVPPRHRPKPNSPVFVLSSKEKAAALRADGDLRVGQAIGDEEISVGAPSDKKSVLPRHTAILGTTGAGKSTTVGGFVSRAQARGFAVVVLDTEGEYVLMDQPAQDSSMLTALKKRGIEPKGISTHLYHLVNTSTANPKHPRASTFGLSFTGLSPYAVAEILEMSDAQQERFHKAYDLGKQVLRELKIFPRPGQPNDEQRILELNDFEEGYPELTLSRVIDIVSAMTRISEKTIDDFQFFDPRFEKARSQVIARLQPANPSHPVSWRATVSRLWRLKRLNIFDQPANKTIDYEKLLSPGQVSIIDLSDTESTVLNNIVIADVLRNIQRSQDEAYKAWEKKAEGEPRKVLIIIEEAHEFLSTSRIAKMPVLFEQVSRISRRGRKRWLGLVFVTQLPQQLPREVLGLVNNYVLHKIADEGVIRTLRQVIPGIDGSLWQRLPALAPGQAIVSFAQMARPLLVSIDPSPCRLRMID